MLFFNSELVALAATGKGPYVVGINDKTLSKTPSGVISSELERHRNGRKGLALIRRLQDRAVVGIPGVGVHADSDIQIVWVNRIGG